MFEQTSKNNKAVKSCLKNNTILSQTAVLGIARSRIGQFLPLQAAGYACTTEQLLDVLLAVSCQVRSATIEQVCADLKIARWSRNYSRLFQGTIEG